MLLTLFAPAIRPANVCTLSGGIQAGDVIGVILGSTGASYAVQRTDTLSTVASSLASACVSAGIPASASGAVVTVRGTQLAQFNVGTTYTGRISEEVRRRKRFFATLYTTTPYIRSFIGKVLENVFPVATRLALSDGTYATLVGPMISHDFDEQQRDTTLMRRVWWTFDFLTTQVVSATQVVAATETLTVAYTPISPTSPTATQL